MVDGPLLRDLSLILQRLLILRCHHCRRHKYIWLPTLCYQRWPKTLWCMKLRFLGIQFHGTNALKIGYVLINLIKFTKQKQKKLTFGVNFRLLSKNTQDNQNKRQ